MAASQDATQPKSFVTHSLIWTGLSAFWLEHTGVHDIRQRRGRVAAPTLQLGGALCQLHITGRLW